MAGHVNARLRKQIGQRLRQLRFQAGISSQESLALKAGVHRTYVGRLERRESGVTVGAPVANRGRLGRHYIEEARDKKEVNWPILIDDYDIVRLRVPYT